MTSSLRHFLLGVAACLISFISAHAQEDQGVFGLGERNIERHQRGLEFRSYALFRPAAGSKHLAVLQDETLLELDPVQLGRLLVERPEAVSLKLHTEAGAEYLLELQQSQPVSGNANLGIIDAGGRHRTGKDDGIHYQGIVVGSERSIATLSAFPNGDVMVLFGAGSGNYNLGKLEDGSGKYVLYNDHDLKIQPHPECRTDDNSVVTREPLNGGQKTTRSMLCNRVRVYWEIANNLFMAKSSNVTTTRNYVTSLFNQVSAMFLNENIQLELSSMYIWTVPDHYPQTTSSTALNKFVQYWNVLGNDYDGDLAHLLTRNNGGNGGGNGGLAYLDVLCTGPFSYGYSDVYGTVQKIPTFSWDVQVITHETGHNLGSKHTHWCGWNTGAGGACGAIDDCYNLESGSSCTTCGATTQIATAPAAWKGSVMSYCHLVSGRGIDLAKGFGPLPGNAIRAAVSSATCLGPLLRANLQPTPICNGAGSITAVFDPLNGGTAPYTYNWSNGGTGQTVSNVHTPGTYDLIIRDSNRCELRLSTALKLAPFPGQGQAVSPAIKMPICCAGAPKKLELRSGSTSGLGSCNSVYWLRSEFPITSFAAAKAHFDTATVTLFPSTSAGSGGALLEVTPPSTCQTPLGWYFTPVAVNLPHAADSFQATATLNTAFNNGSTRLGSSVTLPDQSALPTLCDVTDTPNLSNLIVNVSGYTGRSSKMIIVIRNSAQTVVYHAAGLSGNGSYVIPQEAVSAPLLEALTVTAFDYNCTGASSCTSSTLSLTASRKVRYGYRAATMSAGCQVGASIETSFAQTGCTKLDVSNLSVVESWNASLVPNPAQSAVQLRYSAGAPLDLGITDVVGKRIGGQVLPAGSGSQVARIDVSGWAKGVYFFNLMDKAGNSQRMKLVVR